MLSGAPGGPLPDRESLDMALVGGELAATVPGNAPNKRPSRSAPAVSNVIIGFSLAILTENGQYWGRIAIGLF